MKLNRQIATTYFASRQNLTPCFVANSMGYNRGLKPVALEPDVALLMTASGSLARKQILADISSKYCKTANISRVALQSYHWCRIRYHISLTEHQPSQFQIRLLVQFHVTPISNFMVLMKMHCKIWKFHGSLSATKVPDLLTQAGKRIGHSFSRNSFRTFLICGDVIIVIVK